MFQYSNMLKNYGPLMHFLYALKVFMSITFLYFYFDINLLYFFNILFFLFILFWYYNTNRCNYKKSIFLFFLTIRDEKIKLEKEYWHDLRFWKSFHKRHKNISWEQFQEMKKGVKWKSPVEKYELKIDTNIECFKVAKANLKSHGHSLDINRRKRWYDYGHHCQNNKEALSSKINAILSEPENSFNKIVHIRRKDLHFQTNVLDRDIKLKQKHWTKFDIWGDIMDYPYHNKTQYFYTWYDVRGEYASWFIDQILYAVPLAIMCLLIFWSLTELMLAKFKCQQHYLFFRVFMMGFFYLFLFLVIIKVFLYMRLCHII